MTIDMFLRVDGIDGESTDDKHARWIEVLSFDHGVSRAVPVEAASGGRTRRAAEFQNLQVVKALDRSTPDLSIRCANGKHIKSVELELCQGSGDRLRFMKYTLQDCIVTSVASSGTTDGSSPPVESVTFAYGIITWEYTPIDAKGRPGAALIRTWDVAANKPA